MRGTHCMNTPGVELSQCFVVSYVALLLIPALIIQICNLRFLLNFSPVKYFCCKGLVVRV